MLIADDSPNEAYQNVDVNIYPNVRQYKMPAFTGWFAGRGLVISQVQTEYFLWIDDDFELTDETKMDHLYDIIEKTGYDVIGGLVGTDKQRVSKFNSKNYFDIQRNVDGFCYERLIK